MTTVAIIVGAALAAYAGMVGVAWLTLSYVLDYNE